ncbi:DUF3325 family protein [Sphingobium cupriresistens]|uniref:DUF3325 family protein n=1 Tax=Sphingobium cupriresistens TaxID=1132417 RepID=A0A8G1ZIW1_9SPHN|nr:DUF3325 family protein [Sphingobium cupriresistens]RYM13855.1 DUF3325 family protein [Sphingobium cupriresistens]
MTVTIGLLYLALFALAGRMQRHRPVLLTTWQRRPFVGHLELAGWTLLGLSLLSLMLWADVGMALIAWIGLLPLLGGVVVLGMTYRPAVARAGVPVAAVMLVAGLLV